MTQKNKKNVKELLTKEKSRLMMVESLEVVTLTSWALIVNRS